MIKSRFAPLVLFVLFLFLAAACGPSTESAIATGIAQTQQISELQTAAAGAASTATPAAPPTAAEATETASPEVKTSRDLNMRAGDSTAYGIMTVIPGGESVHVIGINAAGTWYQVSYHDAVGWISVDFTTGDTPVGLPVATPSAAPSSGGDSGGGSGGGGGGGDDSYSFTLDVSNDGESRTVDGELTPGDSDYVTVHFEGFGGSVDTGHLRVILICSAGENDVELSESIPRSNHSNECNGDWDYQIEESDNELVIGMTLPSGFNGNVSWTMIVEVNT
ncbi:MAG: SH3 domain-containing protein [Anaerolineales bacterium]